MEKGLGQSCQSGRGQAQEKLVLRVEGGGEEMHLEMEACPSLCRIAALVLLTLGGKKGLGSLEMETGRGWSPPGR